MSDREQNRTGGGTYHTPRNVLDAIGLHIVDGDVGSGGFLLTLATSPGKTMPVDELLKLLGNPPFEHRPPSRR